MWYHVIMCISRYTYIYIYIHYTSVVPPRDRSIPSDVITKGSFRGVALITCDVINPMIPFVRLIEPIEPWKFSAVGCGFCGILWDIICRMGFYSGIMWDWDLKMILRVSERGIPKDRSFENWGNGDLRMDGMGCVTFRQTHSIGHKHMIIWKVEQHTTKWFEKHTWHFQPTKMWGTLRELAKETDGGGVVWSYSAWELRNSNPKTMVSISQPIHTPFWRSQLRLDLPKPSADNGAVPISGGLLPIGEW